MTVLPLIVIGAGPAGIAASAEASRLGVEHRLIESNPQVGGTIRLAHEVRNVPFLPDEIDGEAVARALELQLERWPSRLRFDRVSEVGATDDALFCRMHSGEVLFARRLLLATGTSGVAAPAAERLPADRVFVDARAAWQSLAPESVAVVGGGDVAFDQARWLRARGCDCTVLVRGAPRAPDWLQERAHREGVHVRAHCHVLDGRHADDSLVLDLCESKGESKLSVRALVSAVGRQPRLPAGSAVLVGQGHPFVRIAGDAKGWRSRHVVAAMGDGCVAVTALLEGIKS